MPVLEAEGKTFPIRTQVLIIGAGACGTIAALAANERGAEVMILEADAKPTGSTSLSGGQIPAADTKLQRAAGLMDDTPEILANDLINKAHGECDHEMAWHIARESGKTIDWLVDRYKLPLSCILDFQYPGHSRMHMHASPSRFGAELLAALLSAVEAERILLATSARVSDLYADPEGRIRGVRVARPDGKTEDMGCDALILACCGYGGDKAMIAKYIPEMADAHYHGHRGNTGDAVKWGEELGASIKDMGSFQGHGAVATPHAIHIGWPAVTEGGYQVNRHGKRFSNENAGYSEQALNVARQPGHVAWLIFDESCHRIAMQMHSHAEAQEAGAIKVCRTEAEIAAMIGCDAATLAQTMAEVAECAAGKKKDPFGRDFSTKPALAAPFRVVKVMGALFHTQGGLEVNKEMRVLRKDGRPFSNLYAGGGAARGLSGPADWGYLSGSGLLTATNMGRLAGESAAELVGARNS
ncbi:MAG: FAD-dependent oxidoreductase [Betaproteobacteria bacterium]|nr:FAD-dependent oxidoreductase [Betaproteobacteria bacterium]